MHRLACVALVLVTGCTEAATSELTFPAAQVEDVILHFNHGSITVRHARDGEKNDVCILRVTESGTEALGAEKRFAPNVSEKRIRLRQRRNEEKLKLDVELVVPAGVDLDLVLREGPIKVDGTYGRVGVTTTKGDVTANFARCEGATLKSLEGKVHLTLESGRLTHDVVCESTRGDVSLNVPTGFRGPVQLFSGAAKLKLPERPTFQLLVDAGRKSARGFAGSPLDEEEKRKGMSENKWPASIFGKSPQGTVELRTNPS
ncbi:MAG: hypothetical protein AAGD14_11620 [Planctomycetota bacterium]